jgi:hypothetical protein
MTHVGDQMNMIGHDDEAASEPMVTSRAVKQEGDETLERFVVVQHPGTAFHAYRQEVGNIAIAIWPDVVQAPESSWAWSVRRACPIVGRVP